MSTIVFEGEGYPDTPLGRKMVMQDVVCSGRFDDDFVEYVNDHVTSYNLLSMFIEECDPWFVWDELRSRFTVTLQNDEELVERTIKELCEVRE